MIAPELNALLAGISSNQRPLDPNGVDVYSELQHGMRMAWDATAQGRRHQEAGYAIFPYGEPGSGGIGHTGVSISPTWNMAVRAPKNALAVVHTHFKDSNPFPSPGDLQSKFPNYVFSGNQLYVTDPRTGTYFKYDIDKWNVPGMNNAFLAR